MTLKHTTTIRTTTRELCRLLVALTMGVTTVTAADKAGVVSSQSQGLHGYIGFSHDQPPAGSGYSAGMGWARNHFRYGPPKFSLNATPQCYDYEIGSPGYVPIVTRQARQ